MHCERLPGLPLQNLWVQPCDTPRGTVYSMWRPADSPPRNLVTIADVSQWLYHLPCGAIAASSSECAEGQEVVPGCACAELLPLVQIHVPTRLHQCTLRHRNAPTSASSTLAPRLWLCRIAAFFCCPSRKHTIYLSQHTATLECSMHA